jgi:hypothetical protein
MTYETFNVLKPIPLAGIMFDLNNVYNSTNDNSTYYHKTCTEFHEVKNCQLSILHSPCIDAIKLRHVTNILQSCPNVHPIHNIPFLTLNNVFNPNNAQITLLDPATQSKLQNHSLPLTSYQSPFLLQSEFTIQVQLNNDT